MKTTVRNRLEGNIVEIIEGAAMSGVDVKTAAGVVSATITTRSLTETGLKIGDAVVARVKAAAVFLEKP
jgi:molybdopterin-binding protein